MPSVRVSKELKEEICFLTFTVHRWYYLFQIVRTEDFYLTKARYMELNPVRKGYVHRAEDWVYSSASRDGNILMTDRLL